MPAPAQPQPEDEEAGDCHQPQTATEKHTLASGFVYSGSVDRGYFDQGWFWSGRVLFVGFFKKKMTMKRHFDISYLLRT